MKKEANNSTPQATTNMTAASGLITAVTGKWVGGVVVEWIEVGYGLGTKNNTELDILIILSQLEFVQSGKNRYLVKFLVLYLLFLPFEMLDPLTFLSQTQNDTTVRSLVFLVY